MDPSNLERDPPPPDLLEETNRRRRRERWSAFLKPFITLTSVVVSVGLLMYFIQTCERRWPENPRFQDRGGSLPAQGEAPPISDAA